MAAAAKTNLPVALPSYFLARGALLKALDEMGCVEDVKNLRDKAEAVRTYAKAAGDFEMQNWAAEVRIRAARRVGQLLELMRANGELAKKGGDRKSKSDDTTLKLGDVNVSRDESANWGKLAGAKDFNRLLEEVEEAGGELTEAAVLRAIKTGNVGANSAADGGASNE